MDGAHKHEQTAGVAVYLSEEAAQHVFAARLSTLQLAATLHKSFVT